MDTTIYRCPPAPGIAYPQAAKVSAAGGLASQAAAGLMVQVMGGGLGEQRHFVDGPRFPTPPGKIALELALGMFDPSIVGRPIRRAVDRDHQGFLQDLVDRQVVQVPAVVPLAEQRRVEPVEQILQMPGHLLPAGQMLSGQGRQTVAGVKIGQVVKVKRTVRPVFSFLTVVHRPGQVRPQPTDMIHFNPTLPGGLAAYRPDHRIEIPPGDAVSIGPVQ